MIRFFDIVISLICLFIFFPIIFIIFLTNLFSKYPILFRQRRVGLNQNNFIIIKFRTMYVGTKTIPTHLIDSSQITPFGRILRNTKLDEIPQFWNVLKGDMSIVGPRPCLLTQKKLIFERKKRRVFDVKPGITGLSQISGIHMQTPKLLAKTDKKMIKKISIGDYLNFIFKSIFLVFKNLIK